MQDPSTDVREYLGGRLLADVDGAYPKRRDWHRIIDTAIDEMESRFDSAIAVAVGPARYVSFREMVEDPRRALDWLSSHHSGYRTSVAYRERVDARTIRDGTDADIETHRQVAITLWLDDYCPGSPRLLWQVIQRVRADALREVEALASEGAPS